MKNKIITTMLFLVLVVSIVGNVYQFNVSKDIEDNIGCYTTELSGLNDNIDSLNNDITAKDNELATLSMKITELESSIQTIKTENDSLSAQVSELEKSVVSTDTTEGNGPTEEGVLKDLKRQLDEGLITQADYDACVAFMNNNMTFDNQGGYDVKPSSEPEVIMPEGALELTPGAPDKNVQMQHFESGSGVQVQ